MSKIDPEGHDGKGVGQPGFLESLIPFWGSGRAFVDDVQNGNWGMATLDLAFLVSDCFMVGTVIKSVGKVGVKVSMEVGKEMTYKTARRKMLETGYCIKGDVMHHTIKQRTLERLDNELLTRIMNQPFVLKKLTNKTVDFGGKTFSRDSWHRLLDSRTSQGLSMNLMQRAYYGSSSFTRATAASTAGAATRETRAVGKH